MTSPSGGGKPARAGSGSSARMSPAERLARALSAKFLEDGNYGASLSQFGGATSGLTPSAIAGKEFEAAFAESGFAGLAVQAVGYSEGSDAEAVYVYVAKGRQRNISGEEFTDDETPIRVRKIGRLTVKPEAASGTTNRGNLFQRGKRIACGSSCAPSAENYSGTLGAIVRDSGTKELFVLSNNHVIGACNHTPVGQPILSPSNSDSHFKNPAPIEIARHERICELRSGTPTLVNPCSEDVAIARVTDPTRISSWQGDAGGYDTPTAVTDPVAGMSVVKFGRTTGKTTGRVEARIPTDTPIPFRMKYFTATVWFRDVWTVLGDEGDPFALPGDSGSLVVSEDGKHAIGLVFAAAGDYGVIIPMPHVLSCLGGLELVGKHGV